MVPHIVIIGGGFGGLSAARALRHADVRVTLIDRRNHHVFQPLLYQVATATLSPGDIAAPIRWILRSIRNVRVLLANAMRIDVAARRIELSDGGSLDYDWLIVATGSKHAYFGHGDWEPNAPGLKTLEDAIAIRRRILIAFERAEREEDTRRQRQLLTFVIVGGGPTGVELAGTLAEIARQTLRDEFRTIDTTRARILLVEAGPTILQTFPEKLRNAARASLVRLGIEVREGVAVTARRFARRDDRLRACRCGNGALGGWRRRIVSGEDARCAARPSGTRDRRAGSVDPRAPEVFVVGDAAAAMQDGKLLPGVAQTAMQGARHAAKNILRRLKGQPTTPFVYRDLGSMAIVGRRAAISDLGWIRLSGALAWLAWLFLHIFMLVGFRNRVVVLFEWAMAYLTFQRGARLITGDTKTTQS